MDVQRGVHYKFHGALPTLLGAANSTGATQSPVQICQISWVLPKLLGAVNFTVHYLSSWALPKLRARLEETLHKLTTQRRYQQTHDSRSSSYHSGEWLMMWRRERIIGSSMMKMFNHWRMLGNGNEKFDVYFKCKLIDS
jgi:hypothetical protein